MRWHLSEPAFFVVYSYLLLILSIFTTLTIHILLSAEATRQSLEEAGDEEELEEFEDEGNIYSQVRTTYSVLSIVEMLLISIVCCIMHYIIFQRLEGGLFNLQQVSTILAYACIFDASCLKKAQLRLGSEDATLEDVLDTLRAMLLTLHSADTPEEDKVEAGGASKVEDSRSSAEKAVEGEYKQVITEWCAALSTIVDELEA